MIADDYAGQRQRVLDPSRMFQGLTAKQELYAEYRFSAIPPVDAYRLAFDCEGAKDQTVKRDAWELDRDSRVVARVAQLIANRMAQSSLAPNLSREFVTDGIMRIAMLGEKESNRLAALIALGKTVGIDLFRDVHVTERRERSADEIDAELRTKLEALQRGLTIEGASRPVESVRDVLSPGAARAVKDRRRKPMAR